MFRIFRPFASVASRLAACRLPVWLPAALAAAAFAGVAALFALETRSFRAAVLAWAGNDLESRTRIAAETLAEPLRGGDFAAVHRFSDECAVDAIRLSVFGKPRGLVFDSLGPADAARRDGEFLFGPTMDAGAFAVRLALPLDHVLAPFRRARPSFLLAALLGVTGVLLFVFALYRQRVRLAEMARVERFRREFIADVSHEIKTPLTGILGAVELLGEEEKAGSALAGAPADRRESGSGEAVARRLLALIRREAQRLNRLVQSILDLARLEREGDVLNRVETDLAALVRDVAGRSGVKFLGDAAARRVVASVDPQLIEEAVSNLVENAKRHSGSDDIAVSLSCDGRAARISVEDHGVGIPAEHAPRIFERFHRVDPARAAETGGAGLGLAIVRRIARLHGGDVAYRPAHPHGCVFTLYGIILSKRDGTGGHEKRS